MCGIGGILVTRQHGEGPPDPGVLRRMAAMLRHRGPDGYGLYADDRAGLAHARLSIVDLAGGAQPLTNERGTVWITFNGEVFNHVELRRELESLGHRFATRSDTEVIVHAYEEWGKDAWTRFNGQFAFGLWDSQSRQLWLVRDGVGIVPLFVAAGPERVVFASEIKAILAAGLAPELDPAGLARVFSLWAAPAPYSVFKGVRLVEPGTALCVHDDLTITRHRFWSPRFGDAGRVRTAADAADLLAERLRTSIDLRLRADVPVGAYLSGGLDSAVIASIAREKVRGKLETFSLRFLDPTFDESAAQHTMARVLGTAHHEITVGPREISEAIPEVVWHAETPLLRTGPAPMFLLSQLVRREGMKVVLTGEGADEFFAGYDIFKEAKVRRFWARDPASTLRPALLARLHPYVADAAGRPEMWRAFFENGLITTDDPFYSHRLRWDLAGWGLRFLSPQVRSAAARDVLDGDVAALLPDGWSGRHGLDAAQAVEVVTFLSAYLLTSQGDRVAMGHGVESRYPFLDPHVIALGSSLPPSLRLCGLRDKVAIRTLASRSLPREVWQRRKWPYRAPIAGALFGAEAPEWVRDLLSPASLSRSPHVEPARAGNLAARFVGKPGRMGEREEMALVGLLTLGLLDRSMVQEFSGRAAAADRALGTIRPDVCVDRRTGASRRPMACN